MSDHSKPELLPGFLEKHRKPAITAITVTTYKLINHIVGAASYLAAALTLRYFEVENGTQVFPSALSSIRLVKL
jgi:hypothetical protein